MCALYPLFTPPGYTKNIRTHFRPSRGSALHSIVHDEQIFTLTTDLCGGVVIIFALTQHNILLSNCAAYTKVQSVDCCNAA